MKKINKYLVFAFVLFSLFFVSPKAAVLPSNSFRFLINNKELPYQFNTDPGGYSRPPIAFYNYSSVDVNSVTFNYVILDVCSGNLINENNVKIENTGTNSLFDSNSVITYNTNITCKIGTTSYNGNLYKIQFLASKYVDSQGDGLYVGSYLKIINTYGYNTFTSINSVVVSDEDVLFGLKQNNITNDLQRDILNQQKEFIKKQNQTNSKLDDLNSKQDKTNDTLTSEDDDTTSKKCGVVCKLKGIFTGIIELPKKIVTLIIDALKSLFVPTDEQLYEIVNDSKELSENFGFVGQSMSFFINIFTSLLGMVNANGCIEMPAFKIGATSLFDEHTFWEARNVCLADNLILSANITTIRSITSIVFVSLFVGFATRKFFSILSKSENEVNSE